MTFAKTPRPASEWNPARGTRVAAGTLLALAGVGIYGWVAAYSAGVFGFSDAIDYLLMADFYGAWLYGGDIGQAASYYRETRFPPLFPLVLAALGAGSHHPEWANLVSCLIAVATPLVVWAWIRREEGASWAAPWIAGALLFYPGYFLLNLNVVSEPLAIALLSGALALLAPPRPALSTLATAALLIGLSLLARTALLPAIPALALWMWRARATSLSRQGLVLLIAVAPIAVWLAYRSTLGSETYLDSLSWQVMLDKAGGWPGLLWVLPTRIFLGVVDNWGIGRGVVPVFASAVLLGLAIPGTALRLWRNRLDAWFLCGYIAMILVWPYPAETKRFLVVVYPCLLLSAITAARALELRANPRQGPGGLPFARLGLVAILSAATALAAGAFAKRAALPIDDALLGEKREEFFFLAPNPDAALRSAEMVGRARILAESMRAHIPQGGCVYSVFPGFLKLHGRVPAFAYPSGIRDAGEARRRLTHCDYYFQASFGEFESSVPNEALEGWTMPLLVSSMEGDGGPRAAAALLVRTTALPDKPTSPAPRP